MVFVCVCMVIWPFLPFQSGGLGVKKKNKKKGVWTLTEKKTCCGLRPIFFVFLFFHFLSKPKTSFFSFAYDDIHPSLRNDRNTYTIQLDTNNTTQLDKTQPDTQNTTQLDTTQLDTTHNSLYSTQHSTTRYTQLDTAQHNTTRQNTTRYTNTTHLDTTQLNKAQHNAIHNSIHKLQHITHHATHHTQRTYTITNALFYTDLRGLIIESSPTTPRENLHHTTGTPHTTQYNIIHRTLTNTQTKYTLTVYLVGRPAPAPNSHPLNKLHTYHMYDYCRCCYYYYCYYYYCYYYCYYSYYYVFVWCLVVFLWCFGCFCRFLARGSAARAKQKKVCFGLRLKKKSSFGLRERPRICFFFSVLTTNCQF